MLVTLQIQVISHYRLPCINMSRVTGESVMISKIITYHRSRAQGTPGGRCHHWLVPGFRVSLQFRMSVFDHAASCILNKDHRAATNIDALSSIGQRWCSERAPPPARFGLNCRADKSGGFPSDTRLHLFALLMLMPSPPYSLQVHVAAETITKLTAFVSFAHTSTCINIICRCVIDQGDRRNEIYCTVVAAEDDAQPHQAK
jgi:hypothetical protein